VIGGYIFDLDGTLLDTLASLAASVNRVLVRHGYPAHDVDAYRYFIGDGLRKCIERCLPPDALTEANIQALMEAQLADYLGCWQQGVEPYDGIVEMLERLAAGGFRLAVLSNKNHEFAVRCVEHFLPGTRFDAVLGHSGGLPHKPDPTGALRIAAALALDPGRIALVGDTATDIHTANAGGMISVGVLWGFRDYNELKNAGATHIIGHPSELIAVTQGENT
jgi:phosphoglycolate phosphatase